MDKILGAIVGAVIITLAILTVNLFDNGGR